MPRLSCLRRSFRHHHGLSWPHRSLRRLFVDVRNEISKAETDMSFATSVYLLEPKPKPCARGPAAMALFIPPRAEKPPRPRPRPRPRLREARAFCRASSASLLVCIASCSCVIRSRSASLRRTPLGRNLTPDASAPLLEVPGCEEVAREAENWVALG